MNVCPNCKEGFEPSCETHVYCSKRCGKAAQKRRTSERKAKHGAYHCPICGKYGIRRVNAGKKIVTCGEKACVAMHKKRYKAATNKRYRLEGRKWPSAKTTCKCGQYKGQASKQCMACYRAAHPPRIEKTAVVARQYHRKCVNCSADFITTNALRTYCNDKCYERAKRKRDAGKEWRMAARRRAYIKLCADPEFRVHRVISARIREAIHREGLRKTSPTFDMLGYSESELVSHIERHMIFGMTWKNYGSLWHIDHVIPKSWFRGKGRKGIRDAWALKNLMPRFATTSIALQHGGFHEGNAEKGNRYAG